MGLMMKCLEFFTVRIRIIKLTIPYRFPGYGHERLEFLSYNNIIILRFLLEFLAWDIP